MVRLDLEIWVCFVYIFSANHYFLIQLFNKNVDIKFSAHDV